jgi:beta-lactamase regulating signal transducer with metallopeptidase domain
MSASFLGLLAEVSIRIFPAAALVGAVLVVLRPRPSGRHLAWSAVMLAMLFMPLLQWGLPTISVESPARLLPMEKLTSLTTPPVTKAPAVVTATPASAASSAGFPTRSAEGVNTPPAPQSHDRPSLSTVVLIGYVIPAFAFLVRMLGGWCSAFRLASRSRAISLAGRLHGIGDLRIRESSELTVPVTLGLLRPAIVLPIHWESWGLPKLVAVVAHERAHIRRLDPAIAFLARLNRCVFWFHPLAWWLERRLATLAEYASDEAALRDVGDRTVYAEVLLDVARALRRAGRRVSHEAVGIGGNGLLGHRIDRVLSTPLREVSSMRAAGVALASVAVLVVAIACTPASGGLVLDSRDDQMAERDAKLRDDIERLMLQWQDDVRRNRAPRQIDQLAATVRSNPDDLDALKPLLVAYWHQASPNVVTARRDLILSLIERHPDSQLSGSLQARLFPAGVNESLLADAVGYEQAKQIWLRHVSQARPSASVLGNAAYFFEWTEPFLAERLLRQAQQLDPGGPWSIRLGLFYAGILTGEHGLRGPRLVEPRHRTAFGTIVRRSLAVSNDEVLLTTAGIRLGRGPGLGPSQWDRSYDPRLWGIECFKRALHLNPKAVLAHSYLLRYRKYSVEEPLYQVSASEKYDQITALPEVERFGELPDATLMTFRGIRHLQATKDRNLQELIDISRRDAKRFAEDALKLAPSHRSHPSYGRAIYAANMTLGALALEDGNREAALTHLRKASEAPPSEELIYADDLVIGMFTPRLATDLLKLGEREAVIGYLERIARVNLAQRGRIRSAIAAIHRGETPDLQGRL